MANTKSLPTAEHVTDWRKHPTLIAHRERLDALRAQLPMLTNKLSDAEVRFREAEEALTREKMLAMAGRSSNPDALTIVQAAFDEAQAAYASAMLDFEPVENERAKLEGTEQETQEAVQGEAAQAHDAALRALLADFADKLRVALAASDAVRAYYAQNRVVDQFYYDTLTRLNLADGAQYFKHGLGYGEVLNGFMEQFATPGSAGAVAAQNGAANEWLARYERLMEQDIAAPLRNHNPRRAQAAPQFPEGTRAVVTLSLPKEGPRWPEPELPMGARGTAGQNSH